MHLVDDVYFVFSALGGIYCGIAQVTDIVNAVVGSSVYFDYIGKRTAVCVAADVTFKTWIAVFHIAAVYSFCEDTCTGGLTCTAGACEKVCVGGLTADYLAFQRFCDIFLRYDIIECHRSPFAVESLVHTLSSFRQSLLCSSITAACTSL